MTNERCALRRGAGLWLSLVTSIGCGEARDAIAPPAAQDQAPPTGGVGSSTGPGAPTSPGASTRECAGTRIESTVPLPGYEIRSQAELDALEGCAIIRGSLSIWFAAPDLRPLHALREVDGELVFGPPLGGELYPLSLDGLEQLERIGWGLRLFEVGVQSLAPLAGLRSLGADIGRDHVYDAALSILGCPELESLAPLSGITTPLESLSLGYNGLLSSISGPPFAERMSTVFLDRVEGYVDLSALAGVRELESFSMHGTGSHNLDFLASLEGATTIDIRSNPALEDVAGLTGLVRAQSLRLWYNPALKRLPVFPSLFSAGTLWITDNATLERVEGFPRLGTLTGDELGELVVQRNPELAAVLGLGSVESTLRVDIAQNRSLQQVDLGALRRVTQTLAINSNPALPAANLSFLSTVEADSIKVGGNAGDPTLLDPCPWLDDGVCDTSPYDTLCAEGSDASDCGAVD